MILSLAKQLAHLPACPMNLARILISSRIHEIIHNFRLPLLLHENDFWPEL